MQAAVPGCFVKRWWGRGPQKSPPETFVRGLAVPPCSPPMTMPKKDPKKLCAFWGFISVPVVGVEPTRVISTRDFEFLSASSIWCHPVIFSDIWFPLCKGKIHDSTNNNLKCPRFFDAFFLYSVFSVWTAKMEIGGMFRRDAGQNAVCLGTKRKESQG